MTVISKVNPGEAIRAQTVNDVIDAVNSPGQFENVFMQDRDWVNVDNMPWYIDPDRPFCTSANYRLHVQVGLKTVECTPYSGDMTSGDFYCCIEDKMLSGAQGQCKVMDQEQVQELTGWHKIKAYTLHGVEVSGSVGGPYAVEYHNVCPVFPTQAVDLALDEKSVDYSDDGEVEIYEWKEPQLSSIKTLTLPKDKGGETEYSYYVLGRKITTGDVPELTYLKLNTLSGGGGGEGVSCSLSGNTEDSEKITGDMKFQAAPSCNIEVKTVGDTVTLGVYYI